VEGTRIRRRRKGRAERVVEDGDRAFVQACELLEVAARARLLLVERRLAPERARDRVGVVIRKQRVQRTDWVDDREQCAVRVERDAVEIRSPHATHCQSAHWVTAMPSNKALHATIAVWTRGRPPSTASARKNGNTTRPKRGSDSSGHRELG